MNIQDHHPRQDFTIAGHVFKIAKPFAEGHILTAGEASSLNQTFAENVRNNMAKTINAHKEAGTFEPTAAQGLVDEYAGKYEFGIRVAGGGRAPTDPVEARALTLAKGAVRKSITKNGGALKDYTAEQITERAKKAVEEKPAFRETARTQIEAEAGLTDDEGMDSPASPVKGGQHRAPRAA